MKKGEKCFFFHSSTAPQWLGQSGQYRSNIYSEILRIRDSKEEERSAKIFLTKKRTKNQANANRLRKVKNNNGDV